MEVVTSRLSDADAVLWTLDRDPSLRSPITAVVIFDRGVPFDAVLERFRTLTVGGRPTIGLNIDAAAIPDPDVLVDSLSHGVAEAVEAAAAARG